jgi:hypothetical protein
LCNFFPSSANLSFLGLDCLFKHSSLCSSLSVKGYIRTRSPKSPVGIVQGWRTFLRARAQIFGNVWRNSFACSWEFWAAKWVLGVFHYHY